MLWQRKRQMNNLKYYNDSLAYDFQMFMPKEKPQAKPGNNVIKMPRQNAKKKARTKAVSVGFSASAFASHLTPATLMRFLGHI